MAVPGFTDLVNDFHKEQNETVIRFFCEILLKQNKDIDTTKYLEKVFSYFWNLEKSKRYLNPARVFSEKSENSAERFREKGNDYYKRKKYQDALEYYNLSILTAPHPQIETLTPEKTKEKDRIGLNNLVEHQISGSSNTDYKSLTWAYSNRSAVFYVLKDFKKCLQDIDLALQLCKSETMKSKLEERKKKCLAWTKSNGQPENDQPRLPKLGQRNESLPSMSSAVRINYNPAKGRHLVAVRNIRPGELLGVEQSYCNALDPAWQHSHCCVCLKKCNSPLPCPNCSMVTFCSSSCRLKGLREDHWLECQILPSVSALNMQHKLILVFKMLNRTPFSKLKILKQKLDNEMKNVPPIKRGFKDGVYQCEDYSSIYHLEKINPMKKDPSDMYTMGLLAVVMTKILEQSDKYFVDEDGKPLNPSSDDLIMTGGVLLNHLIQLPITVRHIPMCKEIDSSQLQVTETAASGIFPTFSLMNHSCIPTTVMYGCGSANALVSVRSIPAGTELTRCYAEQFYGEIGLIRAAVLREKFQVDCNCQACENNWPLNFLLPSIRIKCLNCPNFITIGNFRCSECHIDYTKPKKEQLPFIWKWHSIVQQVEQCNKKARDAAFNRSLWGSFSESDIADLCRFIEVLEKYTQLPSKAMCFAQSFLMPAIMEKTL